MKLTFLGAAHEVTGSRHLLEACGRKILIDYGMEQGAKLYENPPLPCPAGEIDAVFLTHAHVDHSGWLPLLVKQGFEGPIFSTRATADLCRVMLADCARIQESETEWRNRKAKRGGKAQTEPLYDASDAEKCCSLFVRCPYARDVEAFEGISFRLTDMGHLLGSAAVTLTVTEGDRRTVITFSGDIGNVAQRILKDPQTVPYSDYVVMESTYGDRVHGENTDYLEALAEVLSSTFDRGGNVVIPAFAVGRAQEMLYLFREIKEKRLVPKHPDFKVYMDSPMAIEATGVFQQDSLECFDEETASLIRSGVNPLFFPGLRTAVTAEESKAINDDPEPKVILSSSGMCDGGRVKHHLKHNLWRGSSTVLFVGYQSVGTLGRAILDGAKEVEIFGETIHVGARVAWLEGVSGHADSEGLLRWIGAVRGVRRVFVVHGEDGVTDIFASRLKAEKGLEAAAPYPGEKWDLDRDEMIARGNSERVRTDGSAAEESPAADGAKEAGRTEETRADPSLGGLEELYRELGGRIAAVKTKRERNKWAAQLRNLLKKMK